jgi:hypothetical protein
MAFKLTGTQDELRAGADPERLAADETTYRASLGGWYPTEEKPVPGTPKKED